MRIAKDKIKHFSVCFLVSLTGGIYGVLFAAGLSFGKEEGDRMAQGNHWCWYDLLADTLGVCFGYGLNFLIRALCF